MGEASVGERIGRPLRLDKNSNSDADIVRWTEGKTDDAPDRECPDDPEGGYVMKRYVMPDRSKRIEFP
jgi:hypothetical protein